MRILFIIIFLLFLSGCREWTRDFEAGYVKGYYDAVNGYPCEGGR